MAELLQVSSPPSVVAVVAVHYYYDAGAGWTSRFSLAGVAFLCPGFCRVPHPRSLQPTPLMTVTHVVTVAGVHALPRLLGASHRRQEEQSGS